ncbi:anti-sigma factor [Mycobacterium sp. 1274756.6]|uniref:ATP-binding protein n=1 Tax=Mycobacterium sp. 1274756.6 TaxID=1834076 RepID=UPI0007FC6772|nr:anti-sigma factor [Mycobacterium sp. 1274756.6]OBJ71973.1 anti-sigma factor [Mycobacterium sp. 1274756.6]
MTKTSIQARQNERTDRSIELRVAALIDNVAVVRTLAGAIGALEDFDLDSVADLRLAVDEACTQLVCAASTGATLVTVVDPDDQALRIEVAVNCAGDGDVVVPGSFGWHVLSALVDEVGTFREPGDAGGQVFGIVLTKRRAECD